MTKRTHTKPKHEYGIKMDCDICGKNRATAIAIVEGAQVGVCHKCTKFGKVLHSLVDAEASTAAPMAMKTSIESQGIVENYAAIIRKKREEMSLPLPVIAEKIGEKESYLKHIEHGAIMPSLQVAKKLEHELGIKLIETTREEIVPTSSKPTGFSEPSLADLLAANRDKKKK